MIESNIQPNDEVSTNDILEHLNPFQVPIEVINSLKDLKSILITEGTPLSTDKVRINSNIRSYTHYTKSENLIGKSSINPANSHGSEMISLLIHGNLHRIVKEQKFFNGEQGKQRIAEL